MPSAITRRGTCVSWNGGHGLQVFAGRLFAFSCEPRLLALPGGAATWLVGSPLSNSMNTTAYLYVPPLLAAPRGDPFQVTKRRRERRARRDVRRGDIADASALASVDASHGARGARQRRERERDATRIARRFTSFFGDVRDVSRGARVVGVVDGRDTRRDGRDASVSRSSSARVRRDRAVRAKRRDGAIGEAFVFVLRAKETETRLAEQNARFPRRFRGFAISEFVAVGPSFLVEPPERRSQHVRERAITRFLIRGYHLGDDDAGADGRKRGRFLRRGTRSSIAEKRARAFRGARFARFGFRRVFRRV